MDGVRISLQDADRCALLAAIEASGDDRWLAYKKAVEENSLSAKNVRTLAKQFPEIRWCAIFPSSLLQIPPCRSAALALSRVQLTDIEAPMRPRDPELEARIQRLKHEQENAEYRRMTADVDPRRVRMLFLLPPAMFPHFQAARLGDRTHATSDSIGAELRAVSRQMTVVINIVLTVGGAFVFGFYGLPLITPGAICCLLLCISSSHRSRLAYAYKNGARRRIRHHSLLR